nr:hypothetical protein [Tanacetum cinerariifolium]
FKDNPTPSSVFLTKSSSTSPKSVLEETTTFHNSLPEFENFCFDLEEISSGSTTTHSDISLPEYEAFSFYADHIEEIRSGSTLTQSDISLPEYDSFIFDLSDDQFPPTDRSAFTHEGFGDEPGHIISPPEYDCFYFRDLPNSGELISSLNSGIRENLSSTTCVNLPVEDDYSPLLAYIVWIFLAYLTYPVIPPYLHSFENEDTSLTQTSPLIVFIRLSRVYLIGVELSRNSILTSSSISPKSFLEETNTFYNSLLEFENVCFDLEEISSGSTTTHSDISLLDYEAFYFDDDHIKEISSGSTTTHSDISLSEYDSFIFDLADDQIPPTDMSDFSHEEFSDELAHIISPPEYHCFYFRNLPDPGELIYILNFEIRKNLSTTRVNLPVEDNHFILLAYVVWIFLAYLTDVVFHLLPHGPMNSGSSRACDSVNKNKALRGRHTMLISS